MVVISPCIQPTNTILQTSLSSRFQSPYYFFPSLLVLKPISLKLKTWTNVKNEGEWVMMMPSSMQAHPKSPWTSQSQKTVRRDHYPSGEHNHGMLTGILVLQIKSCRLKRRLNFKKPRMPGRRKQEQNDIVMNLLVNWWNLTRLRRRRLLFPGLCKSGWSSC